MQEMFVNIYDKITFEMLLKFLVVYFIIVWIAVLVWVVKDISNRTNSLILQVFSILLILFLTPLWVFVYLLFRPGKTLFEKYYEEIEDNLDLMTEIIHEKMGNSDGLIHCMYCNEPISPDFKYCPHCKKKVKKEWLCQLIR